MNLDDFLESQSSAPAPEAAFSATLEPVPDRPDAVKLTPFQDEHGCGCSSSLTLPRAMIKSVGPTGKFHLCCGKRLEVVTVEFTENAAIPVVDLLKSKPAPAGHAHHHAAPPYPASYPMNGGPMGGAPMAGGVSARRAGGLGLVGRFPIPWTPCSINCIEVCTEFCHDWGWDCCKWETRCAVNCGGTGIG